MKKIFIIPILAVLLLTSIMSTFAVQTSLIQQNFTNYAAPTPYNTYSNVTDVPSSYPLWSLFDKRIGDSGNTANQGDTQLNDAEGIIFLDIGSSNASRVVTGYNMTSTGYTGRVYDPVSWALYGTNTNCSFTQSDNTPHNCANLVLLDTQTGQSFVGPGDNKSITFSNTQGYQYYLLNITQNNGGVGTLLLGEFTLTNTVTTSGVSPIINFTAANVTGVFNATKPTITNFCITGTGTNTSFTTCTTNGTVYNSFTGTYNYTANSTGFDNKTISNFVFTTNKSIQINLTETNIPPIVNSVRLTASVDNQTLLGFGNTSDPNTIDNTGNVTDYSWKLFRNNTLISSGQDTLLGNNRNNNFHNFTTGGINGTYILQLTASDIQTTFSTPLNSSPVTVTFGPFVAVAPILNTVTLTASTDNLTLTGKANATSNNGTNVRYFYRFFFNNTLQSSGFSSFFTSNTLQTVHTFSFITNGTYKLEVTANDGNLNSTAINSSSLVLTVSPLNVQLVESKKISAITDVLLFGLICFLLLLLAIPYIKDETMRSLLKIAIIALVALSLIIMFVLL